MKKIIVNGTFDLIHIGHIHLLNYAKSLGDSLTVCIDTDRRVKEKKGMFRPINSEKERSFILENLKCVDKVLLFDTDQDLIDIIRHHDVLVKGSDYKGKSVIGERYCKVIYYDRMEEYSTTKKIQSIIDRR